MTLKTFLKNPTKIDHVLTHLLDKDELEEFLVCNHILHPTLKGSPIPLPSIFCFPVLLFLSVQGQVSRDTVTELIGPTLELSIAAGK